MRHGIDQALAALGTAVEPDHFVRDPGLVEEDKAGRVHVALPDPPAATPADHIGAVLLGRSQALFYAATRAGAG